MKFQYLVLISLIFTKFLANAQPEQDLSSYVEVEFTHRIPEGPNAPIYLNKAAAETAAFINRSLVDELRCEAPWIQITTYRGTGNSMPVAIVQLGADLTNHGANINVRTRCPKPYRIEGRTTLTRFKWQTNPILLKVFDANTETLLREFKN